MIKTPTAYKKFFFSFSAILIVISIVFLFINGLNLGIDFTGGTIIEFELGETKYSKDVEKQISDIVKKHSDNAETIIQKTGDKAVSIKTIALENEPCEAIVDEIAKTFSGSKMIKNDIVHGTVSARLIGDSLKAIALAIVLMLIYITFRFDFQSGTSAVLALAHDVIIMLGYYAIFGATVNTSFIAAILTIVGYSINATIIIFDRVRENNRTMKKASADEIADNAINASYFRAINSSLTTLFTIGILYVMGVDSIKEFALPIIIGIIAGTYSSLFIAGPFWAWWKGGSKVASQKKSK